MSTKRVTEGERIEVRGSFTDEDGSVEYGEWFGGTVPGQARVDKPDEWFTVLSDKDSFLGRRYADEGKTWRRLPPTEQKP